LNKTFKSKARYQQNNKTSTLIEQVSKRKMSIAFVLVTLEAGSEAAVIQELKGLDNVKDIYPVYGVYDLVVKVEAKSQRELKDTITWKIRKIEKVRSTQTMLTEQSF
jgi:DNA-binding Lrp family transcriptional regulator